MSVEIQRSMTRARYKVIDLLVANGAPHHEAHAFTLPFMDEFGTIFIIAMRAEASTLRSFAVWMNAKRDADNKQATDEALALRGIK